MCQQFFRRIGCLLLCLGPLGPLSVAVGSEPQLVAQWTFGTESSLPVETHGAVVRDQAGPRAPVYPDFAESNTAVGISEPGGYLSIADTGDNSQFDFQHGDELSLEAWIKPEAWNHSSPVYVIGKGRTNNPRFAKDNQNWALRLQKSGERIHIGFLFATKPTEGSGHWHRWTSKDSLADQASWHHIAISYRFGEPGSIRGWIDGRATEGKWDMGGATTAAPVVDDDEVWIGSGSKSNSFVGLLDNVAIYRGLLNDAWVVARYVRVGQEPVASLAAESQPELGTLPAGEVLFSLAEGLPAHDRWLMSDEQWPSESLSWTDESFLLGRIPLRYDDWGIRDAWRWPLLLRLAADVQLPPGQHRLLLRARGLGRLWLDGRVVARTEPVSGKAPDGEQPVTPVAIPPVPGARPHGYRQQEVLTELEIPADGQSLSNLRRMVLELVVGGKDYRTETGEVCVAIQLEGQSGFEVLTAGDVSRLPLIDDAVEAALQRQAQRLAALDENQRRRAAASVHDYWNKRHRAAAELSAASAAVEIPALSGSGAHPIDAFVQAKIQRAEAAAATNDPSAADTFYGQVLPILRDNCFRCHGQRDQGGLKLNSRSSALQAGESEQPAVVPGDPEASQLIVQVKSGAMPPTDAGLSRQQIATLEQWIEAGAAWPALPVTAEQVAQPPLVDDATFMRRVYLDTIGVPPTLAEAREFLQSTQANKRQMLVDRLLEDPRWADHWISLWQDLLAENPTLINQSMGSTGPFRWYLYEALRDHKPLDRMVTELIMMRGSPDTGGSAGFGLSGESDAPYAEKAHILASGLLGVELQCARCHDSPYHSTTQKDLYALAAMLERKTVKVPATSRVPEAFFEKKGRESLIRVTLPPDEPVPPAWSLGTQVGLEDSPDFDAWLMQPDDSRERLAWLITSPHNRRFGQVMVNRIWQRLIGTGLVEPLHDWEGQLASHPELLDWLVQELIRHAYDVRSVVRHILISQLYQRKALGNNAVEPEQRFFAAPDRRRLSAEQVVDSLHAATGREMDVEELTFVHDGRRPVGKRQTLGKPTRAWMFASLNNERDRPSLSLPRAQTVVDVLQAFGWNGSRQKPLSERDTEPNLLQPGILANGVLTMSLSRAAVGSLVSQRAYEVESPEELIDEWFLRILSRPPSTSERAALVQELSPRFDKRILPDDQVVYPEPLPQLPLVTWFNHLQSETTIIQQELERRAAMGPVSDPRLDPQWREAYEDFLWSLFNRREFVWIP